GRAGHPATGLGPGVAAGCAVGYGPCRRSELKRPAVYQRPGQGWRSAMRREADAGFAGGGIRAGFAGIAGDFLARAEESAVPRFLPLPRLGGDAGAAGAQRAGVVRGPLRPASEGLLGVAVHLAERAAARHLPAAPRRQARRAAPGRRAVRLRAHLAAGHWRHLPLYPSPAVLLAAAAEL